MKFEPKSEEELINLVKSLFEANEDLQIALVGGLAISVYSNRRIRNTSDIDIVLESKERSEIMVRRGKINGYNTYYNPDLNKYSIFKHEEGIHIDIYPGEIGGYLIDRIFWEKCREIDSLRVASPEDLIAMKYYAYINSKKPKHLIDIYSIIISVDDLNIEYLKFRLEKIGNPLEIFNSLIYNKIIDQFNSREKKKLEKRLYEIKEKL